MSSIDIQKHRGEIARHLRNGHFERTPGGLLIHRQGMNALVNGAFKHTLYRGEEADPAIDANLVVNEGLNYMLNAALRGATANSQWFIGLFSGNVNPQATWTGANVVAQSTEFTNYSEPTRQEWVTDPSTAQAVGNTGDEAMFTFTGSGNTVRGAFLAQASARGAVTGVLLAAARFSSDRTGLGAPDRLGVEYVLSAVDAGA
jgi:hypothetical protein